MEDNASNNKSILSVLNKNKQRNNKKAVSKSERDAEATAKVQELLKNTPVASLVGAPEEHKIDAVEEHKQVRSQKWLEDQIDLLNQQIEQYENEIIEHKQVIENLENIVNSGGAMNPNVNFHQSAPIVNQNNPIESSMNHTLVELYKHFENLHFRYNHNGDFMVKLTYPSSGNGILEKFLEYFPQLNAVKRYNNN